LRPGERGGVEVKIKARCYIQHDEIDFVHLEINAHTNHGWSTILGQRGGGYKETECGY
jgi:hypothetical protein